MELPRPLSLHKPIILGGDNSIKQAAYAMQNQNIGSVLISNKKLGVYGIITDRDLGFALALRGFTPDMKLRHLVERKLITASNKTEISEIIKNHA